MLALYCGNFVLVLLMQTKFTHHKEFCGLKTHTVMRSLADSDLPLRLTTDNESFRNSSLKSTTKTCYKLI